MSNQRKGAAATDTNLGVYVTKTLASLATADVFTVKGDVEITLLYGVVTGVGDGGATTIKFRAKTNAVDMSAATTVTGDTVGEVYIFTGDAAVIIGGTGSVPVKSIAGVLSAFPHNPMIFSGGASDTIELVQTGDDATHAVRWVLFYVPLTPGATVTAA